MRNLMFLAAMLGAAVVQAAPIRLSHSGYLLDSADHPVDGLVKLRFGLHTSAGLDSSVPDEERWNATYANVPIQKGAYALELGREGGPALDSDTFGTQDLWLGVSVNDAAELKPRLRIGTVPRAATALRAFEADLLGGHSPEDFAPIVHTHPASQIDGLAAAVTQIFGASSLAWDSVTGKPTTFEPTPHVHAASDLTSGRLDAARLPLALDADTVDGKHAVDFAVANHAHTAAGISDFSTATLSALANATVAGGLGVTGGFKLGMTATCDAGAVGTLRYDTSRATALRAVEVCDGTAWKILGGSVDRAPDAITIAQTTTTNMNTTLTTPAITLTGFEVVVTATCSSECTLDKNGSGTFLNALLVSPGDQIRLRTQSGATTSTKTVTVTVGETVGSWTVQTNQPQYSLLGSAGRPGYFSSTPREECAAAGFTNVTHVSTSNTTVTNNATGSNRDGACRNYTIDERANGYEFWGYHYCGSPSWAGFYCWRQNF